MNEELPSALTIYVVVASLDKTDGAPYTEDYVVRAYSSRLVAEDHARLANQLSAQARAHGVHQAFPMLRDLDGRWARGNDAPTTYRVEASPLDDSVLMEGEQRSVFTGGYFAGELASAMGVHPIGRTCEDLLRDVTLNFREVGRMMLMSESLVKIAREVGMPLPGQVDEPSVAESTATGTTDVSGYRWVRDLVPAVRDALAGLREEVDRLGRETTMARLSAGLAAATDPSSTKASRDRLRRELLSWSAPSPAASSGSSRDDADVLLRSVDDLELSVRAANFLANAGIKTVGDLTRRTRSEIMRIKWSNAGVVKNVEEALAELGLSLSLASKTSPVSPTKRRGAARRAR